MKKILPCFLTAALLLAACGNKNEADPANNTAVSETAEQTTNEPTAAEDTETEKDGINYTYSEDDVIPIVEIDGKKYFDFSAEEFQKALNKTSLEVQQEPVAFTKSDKSDTPHTVILESGSDLICALEMDENDKKIAQVYIMGKQSDDFGLSDLAIQAVPILITLDPNIEVKYGAMHLVDIAYAAQISFGSSQYAYEGIHGSIQERIYGEENFIIFSFSPADAAETETVKPVQSSAEKPDFGPLSDDLYSFQIQVNEDVYQFPMTYAEFTAFGWEYSEDDTEMLDANYRRTTEVFKMGDLKCYAGIMNFDVNARPLNECHIVSIKFDTHMVKDTGATITLPKGVTLGGNLDEAIALYGTPTRDYASESSKNATYQLDFYQEVKIGSVYEDLSVIGDISVENISKPDDFAPAEVSDEVPEIVGKYQTPDKISDDFKDFTVEYGGNLYQLPAPISQFVANGWTIIEDASDATAAGKGSGWVTILKDNQKLKILADNYSENATSIINCFATEIKSGGYDNSTSIVISKNITLGMSQADLESALSGTEFEKDDSGNYIYYNINPIDTRSDGYSIMVPKETGVVTKIELDYTPKFADYTNR